VLGLLISLVDHSVVGNGVVGNSVVGGVVNHWGGVVDSMVDRGSVVDSMVGHRGVVDSMVSHGGSMVDSMVGDRGSMDSMASMAAEGCEGSELGIGVGVACHQRDKGHKTEGLHDVVVLDDHV